MLVSYTVPVVGQNWQEWTRQKKTQIKYQLKQIAANKIYLDLLKNGYEIAGGGLDVLRHIKAGDLLLHADRIYSLKTVRPSIRMSPFVKETIRAYDQTIRCVEQGMAVLQARQLFTAAEADAISRALSQLHSRSQSDMHQFIDILSNEIFSMTDDERLLQAEQVKVRIEDHYHFSRRMLEDINIVRAQRSHELLELSVAEKLNALP